jgi:AcrR family transcriptional regulator
MYPRPVEYRPIANEPQQTRSRRSRDSMVAVARELLIEGGAEAVTVAEVSRRAGISVGALYGRFGDKAGLLRDVHELVAGGVRDRQVENLNALRDQDLAEDDIVRAAVRGFLAPFQEEQAEMREIAFYSRLDAEVAHRGKQISVSATAALADLLRERGGAVGDVGQVASSVAQMVFGTAMSTVAFGTIFDTDAPPAIAGAPDWEHVTSTLAEMCLAYIRDQARGAATP